MSTTTMVHVRVDEEVKEKAAEALEAMGLSVSDAVRVFLTRVAIEKALPFEVRVPNALTAKTLEKSERGEEVTVAADKKDLFKKLGI
ncbi:type II toxin-antitoxin system RelB/DinJ family antitoxin [bacterium]|nr:MAG: type II toxin-antitoxin system RelB/DinJ family antitoxin [bacterium]